MFGDVSKQVEECQTMFELWKSAENAAKTTGLWKKTSSHWVPLDREKDANVMEAQQQFMASKRISIDASASIAVWEYTMWLMAVSGTKWLSESDYKKNDLPAWKMDEATMSLQKVIRLETCLYSAKTFREQLQELFKRPLYVAQMCIPYYSQTHL